LSVDSNSEFIKKVIDALTTVEKMRSTLLRDNEAHFKHGEPTDDIGQTVKRVLIEIDKSIEQLENEIVKVKGLTALCA
jgi:hypothetical protein